MRHQRRMVTDRRRTLERLPVASTARSSTLTRPLRILPPRIVTVRLPAARRTVTALSVRLPRLTATVTDAASESLKETLVPRLTALARTAPSEGADVSRGTAGGVAAGGGGGRGGRRHDGRPGCRRGGGARLAVESASGRGGCLGVALGLAVGVCVGLTVGDAAVTVGDAVTVAVAVAVGVGTAPTNTDPRIVVGWSWQTKS